MNKIAYIYPKFRVLVIALTLIMVPSLSGAEPYVELYTGPNFATNMDPSFNFSRGLFYRTARDVAIAPSFIVGGKFGYWFNKESFLSWMKYFGTEFDISYNRLDWPFQKVSVDPLNREFNIGNKGYCLSSIYFLFFAMVSCQIRKCHLEDYSRI